MFGQLPEYERIGGPTEGFPAVAATTAEEVYEAAARGYSPENVFFLPPVTAEPAALPRGCRPVASSPAQLQQMDRLAAQDGGVLRSVGLRLAPEGYHAHSGIAVGELPEVARLLPSLSAITVRGCFVAGSPGALHGKTLGRLFRDCYESAKIMTVTLPCAMPYLCVEGGVAALERNQTAHPETLREAITAAQIVAMQNRTAFYARLMIS